MHTTSKWITMGLFSLTFAMGFSNALHAADTTTKKIRGTGEGRTEFASSGRFLYWNTGVSEGDAEKAWDKAAAQAMEDAKDKCSQAGGTLIEKLPPRPSVYTGRHCSIQSEAGIGRTSQFVLCRISHDFSCKDIPASAGRRDPVRSSTGSSGETAEERFDRLYRTDRTFNNSTEESRNGSAGAAN